MTIKTETISIPAHDGGAFTAYTARPEGGGKVPVIIVIQEIFGVNGDMRHKCEALAEQGYLAVCPDLFWRISPGITLTDAKPEELARAFELFGMFDCDLGVADLKTAANYLRHDAQGNGKIGCIGYCLGGKLAYMLAARGDIDASVGYYGVAIDTMLSEADGINKPLLLHIAEADEFVDAAAQARMRDVLGAHDSVTLYTYPGAPHAFARENGLHYDKASAEAANARTATFLKGALEG